MVNKDSVRQELEKLLASRVFEAKKQACNFLEYVVAEKLAGRGSKITQYGIAVEALGKPTDYCPTENPAVRVEAGRVRKLLEEYYLADGEGSLLRIQLPVGSYEPVFLQVGAPRIAQQPGWEEKSIQSVGPRVYISCQNPASIRDDTARNLVYSLYSGLPVILGRFREVRIALADHAHTSRHAEDELEYAWQHHRAEFILKCDLQIEPDGFLASQVLLHTLTHEVVWSGSFSIPRLYDPKLLETISAQMVMEAFSLNRGAALAYWSRYWRSQDTMPAHYQVLVEHIHFLQEDVSERSFRAFLQACRERTRQYHDDALAHLHFAVLCLYARLLAFEGCTLLTDQWRQLTLKALALNPGNALAHGVFALECYQRGDLELCQVEMNTARQTNPFDTACGHLLAVGLCALRGWERSFMMLGDVLGTESRHPEPFRSIPCLYYFRQGNFISASEDAESFRQLGGWETFGKLTGHCRAEDCQGCIRTLGQAVDRVATQMESRHAPASQLWERIQHSLVASAEQQSTSGAW
ncbi:MAG: hypothetical protein PHE17_01120 [Thiothrix sp.]|uniref:hypothetical protein n=1 Tax=Thiothrix sp. TaxID=1032 RepID=UPI002636E1C6|nr:hypothetical protein [Thiothrix sp.]MDD5391596.1 hypothetical protein [Thiothrix sp.]